ncbi:MAG: class I SAM-dependent methyltransferase [Eubacterium sp.]|jgi:tRNA (adenine22-N1)-methyltransferase|nr:class I SAM-dependent methyltransferase [Eubacterium sp.]
MKKSVILDNRLMAIVRLIRPDVVVCDVGTDHALLPCYLKQMGQKRVFASDKNLNPLAAARETIQEYDIGGIELVLSDGMDNIPFFDNMDIVIAGMGGEMITEILSRYSPHKNQRFILQPMTRHYHLRSALCSFGYEIISETAVNDNRKSYTIIYAKFTGIKSEASDVFRYIGKQTDRQYISFELLKLEKMANTDKSLLITIDKIREKI